MKTFKKIGPVPIYESDHVAAHRTARALEPYWEHVSQCDMCRSRLKQTPAARCWRGADMWKRAQEASKKRALQQ